MRDVTFFVFIEVIMYVDLFRLVELRRKVFGRSSINQFEYLRIPWYGTCLARPIPQGRTGTRGKIFTCSADHEQDWHDLTPSPHAGLRDFGTCHKEHAI